MPIRVVRLQSRNPAVVALFIVVLLAVLALLLTVGLALGAALAAVGGVALLGRRLIGRRLPPPEPRPLDRTREVFPPVADEHSRRLPPGAGDPDDR